MVEDSVSINTTIEPISTNISTAYKMLDESSKIPLVISDLDHSLDLQILALLP